MNQIPIRERLQRPFHMRQVLVYKFICFQRANKNLFAYQMTFVKYKLDHLPCNSSISSSTMYKSPIR